VYYIYDTNKGKLKGKTANGEDVVYSVNNTDVTASQFYDDMYKNNGTNALAQAFVRAVTSQSAETTEEMKSWAKTQSSNVISNYQSSYPSNYKEMIGQSLKSMGYKGFEDLEEYLINYQKQQKLLSEYANAHFDELKIRNISYLLVQFENGDSGEGTPTEDEQKRMDAVDAAFKEGKTFAEVAKEFSEDSSTAESGGVLGVVDKNTTTLDSAFLDGALKLKEGETSDWIYSSNFGYFRIHVNAATPDSLVKVYKEQNNVLEGTEVEMADAIETLLDSYDTDLASIALWEKGQALGVTFTDEEAAASLKKYMGVEE
jgi:foldase protein PrsA